MSESTTKSKAFGVLTHAILIPIAVIVLIPLIWMVAKSVTATADSGESLFLPKGDGFLGVAWDRLTLENFQNLFGKAGLGRAIVNSLFVSSVSAVFSTLICAAAGYTLARHQFRGRNAITLIVIGALVIPPPLLLAPTYELLHNLSLLDTWMGLLLPGIAPAFGVFLFRQATLQSVPAEMLEAARIDACGEIKAFFLIVLPMLRPMVGAFMLIVFLSWWNNFIAPQVILQDPDKFPLAVAIAQLKGVYYNDYGLQMAATLVSVLPVMLLFLMLQRDFIAGLTSGAVKG
ncbi:MAG: carbohydrate ABC transporter permease [Phycisphaerales bacterium]